KTILFLLNIWIIGDKDPSNISYGSILSSLSQAKSEVELFDGLGSYKCSLSEFSSNAQDYLNQGFIWLQSFNHDEAIRLFTKATEIDPNCAIAWWAISYAQGPNYNDPFMTEQRNQASWDALQKAIKLLESASPIERDLIETLKTRYENPFPADRSKLEKAFAESMAKVWKKYPENPDVGAIYAESMMQIRPWGLYTTDREPLEGTEFIVETLEQVLNLNPNHPGACHLYIHAVEQGKIPEKALAVAERLGNMIPASGHMIHMPSHIYTRVNMWDRSITQNELAMEADIRYRKISPDQGIQHMYMVHNNHILAYSAMMIGHKNKALDASRHMWTDIPKDKLKMLTPDIDIWMCSVYDVQKRFGLWDELLEEPAPPEFMPITSAMWRAHRAIAYAAKKNFDAAETEYAEFKELYNTTPPQELLFPGWTEESYRKRLDPILHFVPGEIALQKEDYALAIEHLKKAVLAEDELGFGGEPPEYLQPIRHTLGAVYFKAEKFEAAEQVYREDLEEFPGNGWSLYGLSRALDAQGKSTEADIVERQFLTAWAEADVPLLKTTCECIKDM
uniref:tetratricopeptide repeat protein n=1 Tax=Mariniphaga sediminis TaxID=1628158 RepID=UPI0035657199